MSRSICSEALQAAGLRGWHVPKSRECMRRAVEWDLASEIEAPDEILRHRPGLRILARLGHERLEANDLLPDPDWLGLGSEPWGLRFAEPAIGILRSMQCQTE